MRPNPYRTPDDTMSLQLRPRDPPGFLRPAKRRLLTILCGGIYSTFCVAGIFFNETLDATLPGLLFLFIILAEMPFNLSLLLADYFGFGFFSSLAFGYVAAFAFAATIYYAISRFLSSYYRPATTEQRNSGEPSDAPKDRWSVFTNGYPTPGPR